MALVVTNGLTLNGTATIGDGASAMGALTFEGTQTLDGNGSIVFDSLDGRNALVLATDDMSLTVGPNVTIRGGFGVIGFESGFWGGGSNTTLVNKGTISADAPARFQFGFRDMAISITTTNLTNNGTIEAVNRGTLNLDNTWTNSGTLGAGDGATLSLDGTWSNSNQIVATDGTVHFAGTWSNIGQISATNSTINFGGAFNGVGGFTRSGGTVNLIGILNNVGSTLSLNVDTGTWNILGGTIKGGTISMADSVKLIGSKAGGTLDGMTLNGDLELPIFLSSLVVTNGLTLNGTATIGDGASAMGALTFEGTQTLDGNGSIVFDSLDGRNALVLATDDMSLTVGPNVTIRGGFGVIGFESGFWGGGSNTTLVNKGTISADAPARFQFGFRDMAISITTTNLTNNGTIEAVNRGTLNIFSVTTQSGTVKSGIGSTVTMNGDLNQGIVANINFEVGGTATNQFGRVSVTGTAVFDGTLSISLAGGFSPIVGNSFQIMTYGSHTGNFATVNGTDLGGGKVLQLVFNPTNLTLVTAMPLRADDAENDRQTATGISLNDLTLIADKAVSYWSDTGSTPDILSGVQYKVTNLTKGYLGLAANDTIWIDDDAAGHGWFIDPTPREHSEFGIQDGLSAFSATPDSPAWGRFDLLTVVLHEMGHVLGLGHSDHGLIAERLSLGVRRLVDRDHVNESEEDHDLGNKVPPSSSGINRYIPKEDFSRIFVTSHSFVEQPGYDLKQKKYRDLSSPVPLLDVLSSITVDDNSISYPLTFRQDDNSELAGEVTAGIIDRLFNRHMDYLFGL